MELCKTDGILNLNDKIILETKENIYNVMLCLVLQANLEPLGFIATKHFFPYLFREYVMKVILEIRCPH